MIDVLEIPNMKRSVRLQSLLVVAYLLAGCRVSVIADSADDARAWQGIWRMVSCTYDGQPQMADMEWIVDGDHYTIRLNGVAHQDPYNFTLDTNRKRIDVLHHETPPGTYGGSLKGIYEIDGDSLKVCYDLTGREYPQSLDAPQGSRRVLYKFRHE